MDQITYRLSRGQLLAVFSCLFLALSGTLGWLVGRDLTLPRTVQSVTVQSGPRAGAAAAGPSAPAAGGGRQASTTAAGGAAPASTAAVQSGPVKVGAVITQSGLGDQTPVAHGLDAGLKQIDAQGGVHGITFNLEVLD